MKFEPTYQAARKVAVTVEKHFARHLADARLKGEENLASEPSAAVIEAMIDTAFWASLRREEGHAPKISLVYLAPEQAEHPLLFEERLPLTTETLTKLSPGVERPGIHLGVWLQEGKLCVWGTTLQVPGYCFVLDVSEPGLLVIKHRRKEGFGKFANVAVLIGDQIKIVNERNAGLPDCPAPLISLLGFDSPTAGLSKNNLLIQLGVSMRAHQHGGALLVVPSGNMSWKESIIYPVKYLVQPVFSGLAKLVEEEVEEKNRDQWQGAVRREVEGLAGLTAIDGATVINDRFELLAFGAKIGRPEGSEVVDKIFITEPIVGGESVVVPPSQSGGTRHLSAAQFVHDQRQALAFVASQDGRFTIFNWSPCENMVQAHRIESLLL